MFKRDSAKKTWIVEVKKAVSKNFREEDWNKRAGWKQVTREHRALKTPKIFHIFQMPLRII